MLIRPLSFENLEDRQLLSGVSYDTAPSPTVAAARPSAAVPTPVADQASSRPGSDSPSTDADAGSYGSTGSTPGDSPSEYQSSNMAGMAEYANQRPSYASNDNYGPYASYADQQRMLIQVAGAAQSIVDQTTAARRVPSEQPNPLLARPADVPASQVIAAPSAPRPADRALRDEPGQGVESHAAAEQPRTEADDGEVRFAAGLPIEWRASSDAPGHGEGATETTAAVLSNSSPRLEPLLAGILPVDLPALKAGVERFFARLEELGDELIDPDVAWRLGAWSLTAAGAAAALEFARAEAKDSRPREPLLFGGWRLPPPRPKERPA